MMMSYLSRPTYNLASFTALFLALVVIDQISKWYIFEMMLRHDGTALNFLDWMTHVQDINATIASYAEFGMIEVTSYFNLVAVWNTGVSFGMLQDSGAWMPLILTVFAFIMSVILFIWGIKSTCKIERAATLLIAAGAFANGLDRIRFKAVADFLDFHYMGYHWAAFNLADSCIVLGAGLLLVYILSGHPNSIQANQGTEK